MRIIGNNICFNAFLMLFGFCLAYPRTVSVQVERGSTINAPPGTSLTLWYRIPATRWTDAIPMGNARLGAMILAILVKKSCS